MVSELKLVARDIEDLEVLSAHLQDAVTKVGDLAYLKREGRFAGMVNRFRWEGVGANRKRGPAVRARTGLHVDLVRRASFKNIDRERADGVLNLLAVTFEEGDAPSGVVRLVFSGGAEIRLDVEALEVHMRDIGLYREAVDTPHHGLD